MSIADLNPAPPPHRGGISRRDLIKQAAAVVSGAALLALGGRLGLPGRSAERPGDTLMRSTFAGHLGEAFVVSPVEGPAIVLRLAEVGELPGASGTDPQRERSFSLLFRGAAAQPLRQGTYRFKHAGIGAFAIFIVPRAPDQEASSYEAIFNRLPG